MPASKAPGPATTRRIAAVRSRQRSLGGLLAALALLVAFVGGSLVFAGARPTSVAPLAVATATPVATVAALAGTSSPAVTSAPTVRPEPTAEPTPEPTAEPTPEPAAAPTVAPARAPVATASGDPAGTIEEFYQLVSGHDYASA